MKLTRGVLKIGLQRAYTISGQRASSQALFAADQTRKRREVGIRGLEYSWGSCQKGF